MFTYSREEGTPAYLLDGQIDEQVKIDRMDIIMNDQMQINAEKNAEKVGREVEIIYEGFDMVSETHFGRTAADAPEIDGKVYFKVRRKARLNEGDFVKIRINEVVDYDLYGVLEN